MSQLLDKISKPELDALISSFFRLDNDLVACLVHEQPFDKVPEEIAKMRLDKQCGGAVGLPELGDMIRETKQAILALVTGYLYGKEAGRVR